MKRPSRGERASATTKRYVGCFFAPMRRSLILTMIPYPCLCFALSTRFAREQTLSAEHPHRKARPLFLAAEAHLLHHLAGLFETLDQPVDVGDLRSAALRDALAAGTVENIRVLAFTLGHRANDRLDALHVGLRYFEIFRQRTRHPRNHLQDVRHRSHLANLAHLIEKIVQRELLLEHLLLELFGLFGR